MSILLFRKDIKYMKSKIKSKIIILLILVIFLSSVSWTKSIGLIEMSKIGVGIIENDKCIAEKKYSYNADNETGNIILDSSQKLFDGKEISIKPGKEYSESIKVKNVGNADENYIPIYTRVSIDKKWFNEDGNINLGLDRSLIVLNTENNNWIFSENESIGGRMVFYYKFPLEQGDKTEDVITSISIDESIKDLKEEYKNCTFNIFITVDAIQTHNVVYVIKDAWGVDVTINSEGELSLL